MCVAAMHAPPPLHVKPPRDLCAFIRAQGVLRGAGGTVPAGGVPGRFSGEPGRAEGHPQAPKEGAAHTRLGVRRGARVS